MNHDKLLIHTSIGCNSDFCNEFMEQNPDINTNVFEYLAKYGLPKSIADTRFFDPVDQPISYYANEGLNFGMGDQTGKTFKEDKVFTAYGLFNIVIYFYKSKDEIFVERRNDSCMCNPRDEDCLFCKGSNSNVRLSDFSEGCSDGCYDPDRLYGFAVRNIKPEEIDRIYLYTTNEGDSGWPLYQYKCKEDDKDISLQCGDHTQAGDVIELLIEEDI